MLNKVFFILSLLSLAGCAEYTFPEGHQPIENYGIRGLPSNEQPIAPYTISQKSPANSALNDDDNDGVINARDQCSNTHETTNIANNGCNLYDQTIESVTYSAHFNTGEDIVSESDKAGLAAVADEFINSAYPYILIIGHSDKSGKDGKPCKNSALSLKRAIAIAEVFHNRFHIERNKLLISSQRNMTQPRSKNLQKTQTENRRADIRFSNYKELERVKWTIWSVDDIDLYGDKNKSNDTYKIITLDEAM